VIVHHRDEVALTGTTELAVPSLVGTVEGDDLVAFRDNDSVAFRDDRDRVSGAVQVRVVRCAEGTLDFSFRVTELTGGDLWLVAWNFVGAAVSTDVDYRLDDLGDVGPARVHRQDFGSELTRDHETALHFAFDGDLHAGMSSCWVFVKTDARAFERASNLALLGALTPEGDNEWEGVVDAFPPLPATDPRTRLAAPSGRLPAARRLGAGAGAGRRDRWDRRPGRGRAPG
jgi:hypothetical protein